MSSSDEGEIIEDRVEDTKASSLPRTEGSSVNRRDRIDSRRSSVEGDSASRYSASSRRSRSPRGHKRGYDDRDARPRRRDEPGRFRPDYDDAKRDSYKRSRVSYDDLDNPDDRSDRDSRPRRDRSRDRGRRYDSERDRNHNRSGRQRSRSPYRSRNGYRSDGERSARDGPRDGQPGGLDYDDHHKATSSASRPSTVGQAPHTAIGDAKTSQDSTNTGRMTDSGTDQTCVNLLQLARPTLIDSSEPPKAAETDDFVEPEEFDEEAEIERRRKRREALLAKSSSATPLLLHAVGASDKVRGSSPGSQGAGTQERPESETETPRSSKCTAS